MFNKEDKKKYLRFTDSAENNNKCSENELGRRNIDLIINKLERKVNTGNINSGNADVILKISSQNQETTRTSKNNDSLINNLSNLLANNNIVEKDNECSQELANNANQQNPNKKEIKISAKAMIDVDIDLNNNLKDELEVQETNKFNLILSTSNSHANMNSKNIILSRNKLENKTDNSINNSNNNNISTLSTHFDNSRYFLNKKTSGLIPAKKTDKKSIQKNEKEKEKDKGNNMNLKFSINNSKKDMKKNLVTDEQKKDINLNQNNKFNVIIKCIKKINYRNRYRSCNIMNVLRNILIGLIIIIALVFYATIFIIG